MKRAQFWQCPSTKLSFRIVVYLRIPSTVVFSQLLKNSVLHTTHSPTIQVQPVTTFDDNDWGYDQEVIVAINAIQTAEAVDMKRLHYCDQYKKKKQCQFT